MHVGQEEGHPDGQQDGGGEEHPVVRPAAEQPQRGRHRQGEGEGGGDAQPGRQGGVHLGVVGEEGVEVGGVQVQVAGILRGLSEVHPQDVPQGLAQQQGGHAGGGIGGGEAEQGAQRYPPEEHQCPPQGEDKDGLELAGEGHPQ